MRNESEIIVYHNYELPELSRCTWLREFCEHKDLLWERGYTRSRHLATKEIHLLCAQNTFRGMDPEAIVLQADEGLLQVDFFALGKVRPPGCHRHILL